MDNERKDMKLIVTEKAKKSFRDSTEAPYMRVGAKPVDVLVGCSLLSLIQSVDITDSYLMTLQS